MPASSYRFRQPAWLWAIFASVLSGLVAAAAFGFILAVVLLFMELASPDWSIAAGTGNSWLMFAAIAGAVTVGSALPIIAAVSIVSALTVYGVRRRQSRARSNLLAGYEWLIWATLVVTAVAYPWLAKPLGFDAIWGANYYASASPILLVLAVSLVCAHIARPMYYGIVSRNRKAENVEKAAPESASSDHVHAPA